MNLGNLNNIKFGDLPFKIKDELFAALTKIEPEMSITSNTKLGTLLDIYRKSYPKTKRREIQRAMKKIEKEVNAIRAQILVRGSTRTTTIQHPSDKRGFFRRAKERPAPDAVSDKRSVIAQILWQARLERSRSAKAKLFEEAANICLSQKECLSAYFFYKDAAGYSDSYQEQLRLNELANISFRESLVGTIFNTAFDVYEGVRKKLKQMNVRKRLKYLAKSMLFVSTAEEIPRAFYEASHYSHNDMSLSELHIREKKEKGIDFRQQDVSHIIDVSVGWISSFFKSQGMSPEFQEVLDFFNGHRPFLFVSGRKDSPPVFHGNAGGNYYSGTNITRVSASFLGDDLTQVAIHEILHYLVALSRQHSIFYCKTDVYDFYRDDLKWFDEGMTEYFAQRIARKNGLNVQRFGYHVNVRFVNLLVGLVGEDTVFRAYISGDLSELSKKVDAKLGRISFGRFFSSDEDGAYVGLYQEIDKGSPMRQQIMDIEFQESHVILWDRYGSTHEVGSKKLIDALKSNPYTSFKKRLLALGKKWKEGRDSHNPEDSFSEVRAERWDLHKEIYSSTSSLIQRLLYSLELQIFDGFYF